ncbi:MAG TPA: GWxTD domain-containing protein [Gemmatirosa sp.]|nr:GWxTD domain-containing protein [Gemmatirosa sp.]
MPRPSRSPALRGAALAAGAALALVGPLAGCAGRPRRAPADLPVGAAGSAARAAAVAGGGSLDEAAPVWRRLGRLVPEGDLPFVGSVAFLAGRTPDTTQLLVALSLPSRALSFVREGDRYRAGYQVRLEARATGGATGGATEAPPRTATTEETVRVATLKETTRAGESVVVALPLALAPGRWTLAVAVRDAGSARVGTATLAALDVPRLGPGTLATPVPAYAATPRTHLDTLPRLVPSPRAEAGFAQDSLLRVYVEAYAPYTPPARDTTPFTVMATVRDARDAVLWRDTVRLARRDVAPPRAGAGRAPEPRVVEPRVVEPRALHAGVIAVPVAPLGIGVATLEVSAGARATARATLLVSLGDDLPAGSLDEALGYLRHFATPERLAALRAAPAERRGAAWAAFLRDSDPVPATPEHEALRDYFARLRAANARFGEDRTAGWLTDRGRAHIALGEPDQILDPNPADQGLKGRRQVWQYDAARVQLQFVDASGTGRWRLTAASAAEVDAALRRQMVR